MSTAEVEEVPLEAGTAFWRAWASQDDLRNEARSDVRRIASNDGR
jgi:hypothetical protein